MAAPHAPLDASSEVSSAMRPGSHWGPLLGLALLGGQTLWGLLFGTSAAYSRGHEPLLLAVSLYLLWRLRSTWLSGQRHQAGPGLGAGLVVVLLTWWVGHVLGFIRVEMLALWAMGVGLMAWYRGWRAVRQTAFVWLFLLFVLPLPFGWVLALTGPLKTGVSALAAWLLQAVGYPVGREGVILTVGQYQLLVAEACAGLHSMFVLEAMGLLYSHLAQHRVPARGLTLALMAVPIAFVANVLRVMALVVITYHFGDAVGQGFLHHFAGAVLFGLALVLMAALDSALGRVWPDELPAKGVA